MAVLDRQLLSRQRHAVMVEGKDIRLRLLFQHDVTQRLTNLDVGCVVERKSESNVAVQEPKSQALVDADKVHQWKKPDVHDLLAVVGPHCHRLVEADLVSFDGLRCWG